MGLVCFCVFVWLTCIVLGGMFGAAKNAAGIGYFLGGLLGPIGVLITCVMPAGKPKYRPGSHRYAGPQYPVELPGSVPNMSEQEDPLGFLRR
jgi:amino acid permease